MSEPREEHLLLGTNYSALENVLARLSRRLCITASEPPRPVKMLPTGEWVNKASRVKAEKPKQTLTFLLTLTVIFLTFILSLLVSC